MIAEAVGALLVVVLAAYAVLAGADFGVGLWDLTAGTTRGGRRARDLIERAIAPVWESNHVWLIIALVVLWTAFPPVFGAVFGTLFVPLALAALGIVMRGAGFAFRAELRGARLERELGAIFACSSLVTPYFLGSVVGAIAAGRVSPHTGSTPAAWTGPTSVLTGLLFVAAAAYLAAVFLTVEAGRDGEHDLARGFFARALAAGAVAGVLAVVTAAQLHSADRPLFDELVDGRSLPLVIVSVLAGIAVLVMLRLRITTMIRPVAALAVAAVVAGWALGQYPVMLPGSLTLRQAIAPTGTAVTVLVVGGIMLVVVVPSFVLLFTLYRRGHLGDERAATVEGGA